MAICSIADNYSGDDDFDEDNDENKVILINSSSAVFGQIGLLNRGGWG